MKNVSKQVFHFHLENVTELFFSKKTGFDVGDDIFKLKYLESVERLLLSFYKLEKPTEAHLISLSNLYCQICDVM